MAEVKEIKVPDIGDFDAVDVIEVLVKPGDSVSAEDSLITLESDKATMEIPCPEAGVIKEVLIGVGDKVAQGDAVVKLETGGEGSAEAGSTEKEGSGEEASADEKDTADEPGKAETAAEPKSAEQAEGQPDRKTRGGGTEDVTVPDIGDFDEVEVIEVLIEPGDSVEAETPLITLESDKASMEVPSPKAGKVVEVLTKVGDKVAKGAPIVRLETAGEAEQEDERGTGDAGKQPAAAAKAESPEPREPDAGRSRDADHERVGQRIDPERQKLAHASPSVRRFARELGVELSQVRGSGPKQRILREDVQGFVKQALAGSGAGAAAAGGGIPPIPAVDFSKFGEIEEKPLSRIKKLSGPHLLRSWLNIPHVTQFDEADITELEAFRKAEKEAAEREGVKLTPLAFLVKAAAGTLTKFPEANSSLAPPGEALILKKYVHIGVAVDTPNGLVVPVIRDADKKGIYAIAADLAELSKKARDGKLAPGDMQGGTFSISSLGGIGGTAFTPIVNAPEVAILGVSKSTMKPVWNGTEFVPRLMLPLSLSYDHRVVDGAAAARFTTHLAGLLGDLRRLLL